MKTVKFSMLMQNKRASAPLKPSSDAPVQEGSSSKAETVSAKTDFSTPFPDDVSKRFALMASPGFLSKGIAWVLGKTFYRNATFEKV
ncbi:hypothetical protein LC612_41300 [Nostoc sp. CHAB 5834]|nr:hypothetical protein [Nostoc sp. CHAB 5834]